MLSLSSTGMKCAMETQQEISSTGKSMKEGPVGSTSDYLHIGGRIQLIVTIPKRNQYTREPISADCTGSFVQEQ